MKRHSTFIASLVLVLLAFVACNNKKCTTDGGTDTATAQNTINSASMPLNITIFLDLSDRLTRDLTPSQADRDTAIIGNITRKFQQLCVKQKITNTKNSMQVLFYPTPQETNIANIAEGLRIDCSKLTIAEKKEKLIDLPSNFSQGLSTIYKKTMEEKAWIGCDIWGFFNNGEAKKKCVREGYRNVIVIFTDSYIFHVANKIKQGDAYSYILPQTLENPNSTLIPSAEKYPNLEVLILEADFYKAEHRQRVKTILETWFKEMEVKKYDFNETDLPSTTNQIVDNFMGW